MTALRARATCVSCDSRLPPRTDAWWDEATRTATCLSCAGSLGLLDARAVAEPVVEDPPTRAAPLPEPPLAAVEAAKPNALGVVGEVPAEESEEEGPTGDGPAAGEPAAGEPADDGPADDVPGDRDGAADVLRPPLSPRVQVTALRPRRPPLEASPARRFPSEGATAIEAQAAEDADEASDASGTDDRAVPPLRRAKTLPPDPTSDEGDEDDQTDDRSEPEHVQSAAELIGRLRSVQKPVVRTDPRRGPLVVERPDPIVDRGEIDETRVTRTLEAARIHGVEVLHHRRLGADVEIDHLVIAVNGIWTIVEQEALTGQLDKRDLGDWFTADARLFVGDDDRTDLVVTARAQAEAVHEVLADGPFTLVPVRPVICFGTVPPGWVSEPFVVGGVSVTWRNHLVEPMLDPVLLDRDAHHALVELLVAAEEPAG